MFADDTTMYMGHRNINYVRWCMEQDLINISDWFLANKLTLNLKKFCFVLFKKYNKRQFFPLKLQHIDIPQRTRVKFLGVWIDENLDLTFHCNTLLNKLKRNLHLLLMGQNYLMKHALKLIYYAHIQSHVQYGLLIWGNQCNAKARYAIQKQMYLSATISIKGQCSSNKQKTNKFLELPDLIKLENYKLGYKLLNKMLPDKLSLDISHDKNNNPLTKNT